MIQLVLLFSSLSFGLPPIISESQHQRLTDKYNRSFDDVKKSPWGPLRIKSDYTQEPVGAPNHLYVTLTCGKRKHRLLENYVHCGFKDISYNTEQNFIYLHLRDLEPDSGLCLIRRIKKIKIPCGK